MQPAGRAGTLIGRSRETAWLEARLDAAMTGDPQLVLIEGEAGVGKSRLVRELQRTAKARRVDVTVGRCREHLELPYLAFVTGLLPRLERLVAKDPELADSAHLIRRLLGRPPGENEPRAPSPEHEQTWVFLAVAQSVVRLAQRQPTVVAIEDLHWADRPSIDLLTHVILEIADTAMDQAVPLLVVATLRPDVDPRLADDLDRLRREDLCHSLPLRGLSEAESGDMLRALGHERSSRRLVAAVHQATQGNPLLVENVIHQLVQPGVLDEQDGEMVPGPVPIATLVVPEELTELVTARLQHTSPSCRETLVLAAFIGDAVPVSDLTALGRTNVDADLAEARTAGLLAPESGPELRFANPVYTRVVHSLPIQSERRRLHLAIADMISELPPDERDARVLELEHHLVGAGPLATPERVLTGARAAADRAWSMFAWAEAAQAYEAAIQAGEQIGLAEREIGELAYRAGVSWYRSLETGQARAHLRRAADHFRSAGDVPGLARALMEIARTDLHQATFGAVVDIEELEAVLALLREVDPAVSARMMSQIADMYWVRGDLATGETFARQALDLGRAAGDATTCIQAEVALTIMAWLRLDLRAARELLDQAHVDADALGDRWNWGRVLPREALTKAWLGQLEDARLTAERGVELTTSVGDHSERSLARAALVATATARGDFAEADRSALDAWDSARVARYEWGASFFLPTVAGARVYAGADASAEHALDQWSRARWSDLAIYDEAQWLTRQWVRARAGLIAEVRHELERRPGTIAARWPLGIGTVARFATLVELAELTGTPIPVERVERALAAAAAAGQILTEGPLLQISRIRGVLARIAGNGDLAVERLEAAVEEGRRLGLGPELARARLDLAIALRERNDAGDAERAASLALEAKRGFYASHMDRFASQAAREMSSATPLGEAATATTVILFTDVADSTALAERWGDDVYRGRATQLDRSLREAIVAAGGRAVEGITLGDGVLAVFSSVRPAIDSATAAHEQAAKVGLSLHVGIHMGRVRYHGAVMYGGAINLAARVCEQARPGETLVSDAVRTHGDRAGVEFDDRGLHSLKGIVDPQRLHAIVRK